MKNKVFFVVLFFFYVVLYGLIKIEIKNEGVLLRAYLSELMWL